MVNNLAIADGEIDFRIIKYDQAYQLKLAIYCLDMKDIEMPYEIGTLNKHILSMNKGTFVRFWPS